MTSRKNKSGDTFNQVAEDFAAGIKPFKKAIALLRDLAEDWGPSEDGKVFSYDVIPFAATTGTTAYGIIATYARPGSTGEVPTLVIGTTWGDAGYGVASGKARPEARPEDPAEQKLRPRFGYEELRIRHEPSATMDRPVKEFMAAYMSDHPRYKQAITQAISTIPVKNAAPGLA